MRRSRGHRALVAGLGVALAFGVTAAQAANGAHLCEAGTRIGRIDVVRVNVFDPKVPGENRFVYRLVNLLHRPNLTRPHTVRHLLTVRSGEPCTPERLEEAERELREFGFVQDAWVEVTGRRGDEVDLLVRVRDAWTTSLGLSASSQGGASQSSISLHEENLLGTGTRFGFERDSDQDRVERAFELYAPAVLPWRMELDLRNSDNSDGHQRAVRLERPFFSLETRFMFRVDQDEQMRVDKVYVGPDPVDFWSVDSRSGSALLGWSPRGLVDDRVSRLYFGVAHDRQQWAIDPNQDARLDRPDLAPSDRDLVLGHVAFEWQHVDFRRVRYLNLATRVEDFDLGTLFSARIRTSLPGLSKDSGGDLDLTVRRGFALKRHAFMTLRGGFRIARLNGEWRNALTTVDARYWRPLGTYQTFYARAFVGQGRGLDGQERFLLGGDTGLRGYRSRAFTGENQLLLTAEHRYFAPWELFHVLRVGLVGFAEVGAAWDGKLRRTDLHPDVGLGLRLAILRSSAGTTLHFNVAAPIGGVDPGERRVRYSVLSATTF